MELSEVRVSIDSVDKKMREAFIERMGLAKQVAQIKAKTEDNIYKPDREAAIIEKNSAEVPENIKHEYKAFIKRIMEVSRKYQYGLTLEMRDCFPFSYKTALPKLSNTAMLSSHMALINVKDSEGFTAAASLEELIHLINNGSCDSGLYIISEPESESFYDFCHTLKSNNLYINDFKDQSLRLRKLTLITFSKTLVAAETDNRIRIVFECPNKSGSLAGILTQISDYGINLTDIHSKAVGCGESKNYEFFLELDANLLRKDVQALLFQLSNETTNLSLFGSYQPYSMF